MILKLIIKLYPGNKYLFLRKLYPVTCTHSTPEIVYVKIVTKLINSAQLQQIR